MREAALAWARRGFRVFPLFAGAKTPAIDGWTRLATTDEAQINAWWTERDPVIGTEIERPYNFGVLTTDMVVLDVDVKNGKPGLASAFEAGVDWDTLTVRTPTGGWHLYYLAPDSRSGVDVLGPGVDSRSHNGYVVGPGSIVDGKAYEVLRDVPPRPLEARLVAALARPVGIPADVPAVELDMPTSIEHARDYLLHAAPLAVEGQGGHNTTYRVACRCRDYGLSEDAVAELMLAHWNARCAPPWDEDELRTICANADRYAVRAPGTASPSLHFNAVSVDALVPDAPKLLVRSRGIKPAAEIPPRQWVMDRLLLKQQTTLLVAAGSAGKSTLVLIIAAHIALGRDFLGFRTRIPGKSVIYNAEDDDDESARRLHAVCQAYGFPVDEVAERITILGAQEEIGLQIAHGDPPNMNPPAVAQLLRAAKDPETVMLALDPMVDLHNCRENDNAAMRFVMSIIRYIAREADVALLLAHHTSQAAMLGDGAGEATASRGATAIVNAARIAVTLSPPSQKDVDDLGIRSEERGRYARLDDAKMNLSLVRGRPSWLRREGVRLINGDEVGVLVPHDASASAEQEAGVISATVLSGLRAQGLARVSISAACSILQTSDPLYAKLPVETVKSRIIRVLQGGRTVDGDGRLVIERDRRSGREEISVVLE